jgi:hypothetical protein
LPRHRRSLALVSRSETAHQSIGDDYGIKGKIGVLGNTTSTDEGILKLMGDEAVDTFSGGGYAASLDTADNKKFEPSRFGQVRRILPGDGRLPPRQPAVRTSFAMS